MIEKLIHTDPDYAWTFLRIVAGLIVFPYGMQKLFGWFRAPGFGPPGIKAALAQRRETFLYLLLGSLSSGSRSEVSPLFSAF